MTDFTLTKIEALYQKAEILRNQKKIGLAHRILLECLAILDNPTILNKRTYYDEFPVDTISPTNTIKDKIILLLGTLEISLKNVEKAVTIFKSYKKYEPFLLQIYLAIEKYEDVIEICYENMEYNLNNNFSDYEKNKDDPWYISYFIYLIEALFWTGRYSEILNRIDDLISYPDSLSIKQYDECEKKKDYMLILKMMGKVGLDYRLKENNSLIKVILHCLSYEYCSSDLNEILNGMKEHYNNLFIFFHNFIQLDSTHSELLQEYLTKKSLPINYSKKRDLPYSWISKNKNIEALIKYDENELKHILENIVEYPSVYVYNDPIYDLMIRDFSYEFTQAKIKSILDNHPTYDKDYSTYGLIIYLFLEKKFEEALAILRDVQSNKEKFINSLVLREQELINLYFNLICLSNDVIKPEDIFIYKNYFIQHYTDLLEELKDEALNEIKNRILVFETNNSIKLLDYVINRSNITGFINLFEGGYLSYTKNLNNAPLLISTNKFYSFYNQKDVGDGLNSITQLFDNLENDIRTSHGLPLIGQGSLSEALMVEYLKREFDGCEVQIQASPNWLKRQRYDAFIPKLNLAIEYQGIQHFKSIDYFGGEIGFEYRVVMDKKKKELSEKNGVSIEYINYNDNIMNKVKQIKNKYFLMG
ncbi:MAG: hypothetical protein M1480_17115 [Bacteroidetes bacterium]|nr:hypothetical protein [Bacteroidota bacterium]MCL5030734.1 hypothetical protein [Bacteroidota bacterium]